MRLIIKRDQEQKKGLLGGNKGIEFSMFCRVDLEPAEKELIEKAKAGDYPVATYNLFENSNSDRVRTISLTVNELTKGFNTKLYNVGKILDFEDDIKAGCQNLKTLLMVIESFGGEEVIEF